MMPEFLWYAWWVGLGIAIVAGPLGCFVVWRRMAYFGDTLAHSALLGVALSVIWHASPTIGVLGVCALLAILLVLMQRRRDVTSDTLLGILSHTALAAGLLTMSLTPTSGVDVLRFLYGDILSVSKQDLISVYAGGALMLLILAFTWRNMLSVAVHEALAKVEGVPVLKTKIIFSLLLAIAIAFAIKLVGVLLITSLLIIPAATAKSFAKHPLQMACIASVIGCICVTLGLLVSMQWDVPTGPAIVLVAGALYLVSLCSKLNAV